MHPALQDLRSLRFHNTDSDDVIAFSKVDGADTILVICTLDPYSEREATVWWDMGAIGLTDDAQFAAHDLVTDSTWTWGASTYVRLRPWDNVAHVVHVQHH